MRRSYAMHIPEPGNNDNKLFSVATVDGFATGVSEERVNLLHIRQSILFFFLLKNSSFVLCYVNTLWNTLA